MSATSPFAGRPSRVGLYMFQAYSTDASRPVTDPQCARPRGSCRSIAAITPSVLESLPPELQLQTSESLAEVTENTVGEMMELRWRATFGEF
jgi:hypothetical protein